MGADAIDHTPKDEPVRIRIGYAFELAVERTQTANRQAATVVVVTPDGQTLELARFTEGDVPRGLALAPVTPQTRRAGIAGDLFIVVIRRGIFAVNEVVRVAGPLESFIRGGGVPRR